MTMYQFRVLFQVTFPHAYYGSEVAEDLEIEPSPTALRPMNGQNFLFRSQSGSFLILAQIYQGKDEKSTAISVSRDMSLAFYIKVQGDLFFKVTQVPVKKGVALYANNLNEKTEGLMTGDWEVLPYRPSVWSYDLTTAVGEAGFGFTTFLNRLESGGGILVSSYCVKRPTGEVVFMSSGSAVLRKVDLSLSGLTEGCYSLQVTLENGQALPEYLFLYSDVMDWSPTLAMYEWFPQSKEGGASDLIPMNQSYEVAFEHVQSYWRYYVVPMQGWRPSSMSLFCDQVNGVETSFGTGCATMTPDGRDAVSFTSKLKIPLRESSSGMVEMEQGVGGESSPLPFAAPGYVMEKKAGKLQTISEIYVYL